MIRKQFRSGICPIPFILRNVRVLGAAASDALYVAVEFSLPAVRDAAGGGGVALRPNNRRGGVMFLIVGGISTGFLVYFLSQVIYAFGINGYIPPILAVWTPTLIVMMVSVSALLHLEDG